MIILKKNTYKVYNNFMTKENPEQRGGEPIIKEIKSVSKAKEILNRHLFLTC